MKTETISQKGMHYKHQAKQLCKTQSIKQPTLAERLSIRMINILFFIIGLSLVSVSCDEDNTIQKPEPVIESSVFKYTYNGMYEMLDINLYIGPNGEKIETDLSYLKQYWKDVQTTIDDTLIIDIKKDSLYLKDEDSMIKYGIKIVSDSIFVRYRNDTFGFFGQFNKSKLLFDHYKSFYVRVKMARPEKGIYGAYTFHKGSEYGVGTSSDHFYENCFESPQHMTKEGDKILWSNFKFDYKQVSQKAN